MKKTKINSLEELFDLYPNKSWDYDKCSSNPDLTWERIVKLKMNNWSLISRHRNVTWQIIVDNIDLPWNWTYVSQNPNITMEIVNTTKKRWNWCHLSSNSIFTMEHFKCYGKNLWSWFALSHNPNLTWTVVVNHFELNWDWYQISQNRTVTWQIISINRNLSWNWRGVSLNPNITWQVVVDNLDLAWNFEDLTKNPNMTCQIIQNNQFQQHSTVSSINNWIEAFSQNINITWQIIENNLNHSWNWYLLSKNPHITFEEVTDTLWKPWHFEHIHPQRISSNFLELKHELHLNGLTYGDFLELQ